MKNIRSHSLYIRVFFLELVLAKKLYGLLTRLIESQLGVLNVHRMNMRCIINITSDSLVLDEVTHRVNYRSIGQPRVQIVFGFVFMIPIFKVKQFVCQAQRIFNYGPNTDYLFIGNLVLILQGFSA